MSDELTVYILSIDHKHGTNTYSHRTAEGAHRSLVSYVTEFWDTWVNAPMPADDDEMIELYFDQASGEESYWVDEITLED